jgi:hypothetical protein
MEILNTLQLLPSRDAADTSAASEANQSGTAAQLQVGDIVGFDDDAGGFPLAVGTMLFMKPEDKSSGTDECIVVQVGPKVLGIYLAEQLVRLRDGLFISQRDV